MKQMSESSRRAFLAAIAASGVGAAALPSLAHAEPAGGSGVGFDGSSSPSNSANPARTEAFPAPTPGTYYTYIHGDEFVPLEDNAVYSKGLLDLTTSGGAPWVFYASLAGLPSGAQITEVIFAVVKAAVGSSTSVFAYKVTSGTYLELDQKSSGALPVQATEQYLSLSVANDATWTVDNEQSGTHQLVATLINGRVNSVRVGWTLNRPRAFIPIDPKRAYDSRFISPLGALPANNNRVISIKDGYAPDTSTINAPDFVPAGAKAIAYNVTIVNTVGAGFLSVSPGDAAALGASTINWSQSGQILANGLVVKLDNNRQVKVFCGGGTNAATDFIIDINGYYI